jgi:LAO/AO transport system kinase
MIRNQEPVNMKKHLKWQPETLRTEEIISLIESGNIRGLTKAISIVENDRDGKERLLDDAFKRGSDACITIGFTGAPGTGKSTLINAVIRQYRQRGKTVGVIAVDPTSPFSGGAVLGDRIRMQEHNTDPGVFIRSLASRKALGGLSEATKFALYLYRAFAFDIIIIETLGVGQDEIDVAKYVDLTVVLLVPGQGDNIQLAKAGIMEIADIFVINKSDRPGADLLTNQVLNTFLMKPENERPPIVNTVADKNEGVQNLMEAITLIRDRTAPHSEEKYRQRINEEIRSSVFSQLNEEVNNHLEKVLEEVLRSSITPLEASKIILRMLRRS